MDCDLTEFWVIANEEIWGHTENKVNSQVVARYTFFSKWRLQLAIVSEQRQTIVLPQLPRVRWPSAQTGRHGSVFSTDQAEKCKRTLATIGLMAIAGVLGIEFEVFVCGFNLSSFVYGFNLSTFRKVQPCKNEQSAQTPWRGAPRGAGPNAVVSLSSESSVSSIMPRYLKWLTYFTFWPPSVNNEVTVLFALLALNVIQTPLLQLKTIPCDSA